MAAANVPSAARVSTAAKEVLTMLAFTDMVHAAVTDEAGVACDGRCD